MKLRQALMALAAGLCLALPLHTALATAAGATTAASTSTSSAAGTDAATTAQEEIVYSLIVKPNQRRGARLLRELRGKDATTLERRARMQLRVARQMSGGAHVIRLPHPMPLSEARALAATLMHDSSVELAEPDRIVRPLSLLPSDPSFASMQWNLQAPSGNNRGGINMPGAWDNTMGSAQVTVALLDGGIVPHADLTNILPGYDFLGTSSYMNGVMVANGDGDGRDANPGDPGTYTASNECGDGAYAQRSTWHGTHVAGIIHESVNNGMGGAGIAPNVRLLPVRVLGRCGGPVSDIVDGMRWAAGLSVPGVPANPWPARVLNMSLGSSGSCSFTFQSAVNDVVNAGKIVVAAAGNDGGSVNQPANCSGAIAVTAHTVDGDLANYSNVGSQVAISAPGGGCGINAGACLSIYSANGLGVYSLSNSGSTGPQASPGGDSYAVMTGTSMATPHVTGVIALMLSLDPGLTRSQIVSYLRASARPFPANSACGQSGYAGKCGAGLLDAAAALAVIAPDVQLASSSMVVPPMTYVPLQASVTAPSGRNIVATTWAPLPGNPSTVSIDNAATPNAGFNAPLTGSYGFVFTALDNTGKSASATVTVRVNSVPVLAAIAPQSTSAGGRLDFQLVAVDKDGDTPVFHADNLPDGATLSADGRFDWPSSVAGSYAVTYYASDSDATSAPSTVMLNVSGAGGGSGAGAMDADALAALAVLALALRIKRYGQRRRAHRQGA